MTSHYDTIVLGLGGMGSAAVAHLARRGQRVLGLDAYRPRHSLGSSHGKSRIIREAYFEAPEYVPLVQRAYDLWRELEAESGRDLLMMTGGLNIGEPDSEFVTGSLDSARTHNLPHEYLSASDVFERFPGFRLPDELVAVFEPNAGILQPEECVVAHLDVARKYGADLRFDEPARNWTAARTVQVTTDKGAYTAERLVIAVGPWAVQVLAGLKLPLTVLRIVNVHFQPDEPELFAPGRCPVYLFQVPEGDYYGFPALAGQGIKFGRHDIGEVTTPETIRREVDLQEIKALRRVLNRYLPGAGGGVSSTLTCMYTNTPDRDFVIDFAPGYQDVVVACGFSGHGFKFASVVGEVLADLATEGETRFDIGFLSAGRFLGQGTTAA